MDLSVLPASRVPPQAPATVTGHQHESGCEQGLSQLPAGRGQKVSLSPKSHPGWGKSPPSLLQGWVRAGKTGTNEAKNSTPKKMGKVRGEHPPARARDPLPEAEAAEEEEGERAKAASRCGDGRFFHMAATPRYGHPGPIPVAYK